MTLRHAESNPKLNIPVITVIMIMTGRGMVGCRMLNNTLMLCQQEFFS